MQYTLRPNDVRLREGERHWLAIRWRRRIDGELRALAALVARVHAARG